MATRSTPQEPQRRTITLSDGSTITLDESYYQRQDAALRARLAAPPLSDEELAQRRAEHPDEAWLWTRESQHAIHQADECQAANTHGVIYGSDEELQAGLDRLDGPDADV